MTAALTLATASPASADSATPLTFDQALRQIVDRNTAVASESANLSAAHARALPARLVFAPSLSVTAKAGTQSYFGPPTGGQSLELDSQLNLFRFGADIAGWGAATADIESEEALVASAQLAAEDQAVQVLIGRLERRLEVGVDERIAAAQDELHRIARERYERGLLPLQEADKVAVDLDNSRARLADARLLEIQAQADLATALGRSASDISNGQTSNAEISGEWPWLAILGDNARVDALLAVRFDPSLRPDWRAAARKLDAESDRATRSERLILPSFDASFSYATSTGFFATIDPAVWGPGYTGTLALTIPLFDHLVNYSNARIQASVRDVANEQLEQTRRNALGEWEAASRAFRVAVDSARAREQTLAMARRLYQDNLARFRAGKVSANDLSVDQTRLSDSELFAVQGWASAHLALSRVCHALGRSVATCR